MAGRIPKSFIDEVLARTDIVDIVGSYIPLTKGGRDHKACCPFHQEKTPSFTVSQDKQFYHCFGCGAHGSALGFVMEYAGLDFVEAVENLAERLGLEVPREGGEPREDYGALHQVLNDANAWFQRQLRMHDARDQAVEYLKGRGLSGTIAAKFQLGFAPTGRDALLRALAAGDSDTSAAMLKAGLAIERTPGTLIDKFRNRIVFPIHNRRGQVVGFGGRVLDDGQPKYLNSPETPVFHKGRELYGLWQARRANRKLAQLVVVEGYMDVVALAQFGITYAVASLGTAATGDHVERLFQATSRVVFSFDGDRAGRQAAWRALENALPHMRDGREIGFVFLPDGEDPDTLVRAQGADAFEALLAAATPLSDYLFAELCEGLELSTIEGRSSLVKAARPLLEKLPPGAFCELAWQRLAELTKLAPQQLRGQVAPDNGGTRRTEPYAANTPRGRTRSIMQQVIGWLVRRPDLAQTITNRDSLRDLTQPGADLLNELLDLLLGKPDLTQARVVEYFRDHPLGRHIRKLATDTTDLPEDGLEAELSDALDILLNLRAEERVRALTEQARTSNLSDAEKEELKALLAGQKLRDRADIDPQGRTKSL